MLVYLAILLLEATALVVCAKTEYYATFALITLIAFCTLFSLIWYVDMWFKFWRINRTAAAIGSDFQMEHGLGNYIAAPKDLEKHMQIAMLAAHHRMFDHRDETEML